MEKCPKCGVWRYDIDTFRKEMRCYVCGYVKKLTTVEVERWLDKNDMLPKLTESLRLRGMK